MPYSTILAAIDAELERLHRARLLLTSEVQAVAAPQRALHLTKRGNAAPVFRIEGVADLHPNPEQAENPLTVNPSPLKTMPRSSSQAARLAEAAMPMTAQIVLDPLQAATLAELPQIVVQRRARAQRVVRRSGAPVKATVQALGALAGAVPATPVYVSAAQMRQVRDERAALDTTAAGRAAAALSDVPTAEMLSRRWLSSAAN